LIGRHNCKYILIVLLTVLSACDSARVFYVERNFHGVPIKNKLFLIPARKDVEKNGDAMTRALAGDWVA